jgi:fructoselysine transporter
VLGGLSAIALGTIVYFTKAKVNREWPFKPVNHLTGKIR